MRRGAGGAIVVLALILRLAVLCAALALWLAAAWWLCQRHLFWWLQGQYRAYQKRKREQAEKA